MRARLQRSLGRIEPLLELGLDAAAQRFKHFLGKILGAGHAPNSRDFRANSRFALLDLGGDSVAMLDLGGGEDLDLEAVGRSLAIVVERAAEDADFARFVAGISDLGHLGMGRLRVLRSAHGEHREQHATLDR